MEKFLITLPVSCYLNCNINTKSQFYVCAGEILSGTRVAENWFHVWIIVPELDISATNKNEYFISQNIKHGKYVFNDDADRLTPNINPPMVITYKQFYIPIIADNRTFAIPIAVCAVLDDYDMQSEDSSDTNVTFITETTTKSSVKFPCQSCLKDFKKETLDKWGGVCNNCYRKINKNITFPCQVCLIEFSKHILEKYNGKCKNVHTRAITGNLPCNSCGKDFKKETLDKHGGMCNACFKKTRPPISKKLRREVWDKRNQKTIGPCFSCKAQIDIDNFECGHIVPFVNGGETTLTNLEPICKACNRSCSSKHLYDFMKTLT